MTTLALLSAERRAVAEKLADMDLDDQTFADTLESMTGALEEKAQACGFMVRAFEADAAAIEQWAALAIDKAKTVRARADRIKHYVAFNLEACGMERVDGPGISLSFRNSSAVVIDGVDLIPWQYMRRKPQPDPEPDKTAIAAAIKAGADVPGAHIEHRRSLQIK